MTRPGSDFSMTRRQLVLRGTQGAFGLAGLSALVAACGGDDSSPTSAGTGAGSTEAETTAAQLSGTINFFTYPGWIGENEYSTFQEEYPDVTVKEIPDTTSSTRGKVILVRQNPDAYDMLLLGLAAVPDLTADPSLLAPITVSDVPNLSRIPESVRADYSEGIPTDYGKIGFGYRKDLISEQPTTWAEVWELAPKYSGRVTFLDVMEDCMGNTLKMLGYSGNSTNDDEINAARDKLLEIKPHLQAFVNTDVARPLIKGTSVITMDWDFDIAAAKKEEPNITWVAPEEGLMAYLEGWVALNTSQELDEVKAFMDFHLEPENYADFVNTTGTAYLMPDADEFIDPSIREDPILAFDEDVLARTEFEQSKGDATKAWTEAWNEVKAG